MFQFPAFASQDLCIQSRDTGLTPSGFPHSDISGSKSGCRLPEAFRRLQRPSSPPAAKASTVCACSLDHIPKRFPITRHSLSTTPDTNLMRLTRPCGGVPPPQGLSFYPRSHALPPSRAKCARARACVRSVRYHTYVSTLLKNGAHGVLPHARSSATLSLFPGTACA